MSSQEKTRIDNDNDEKPRRRYGRWAGIAISLLFLFLAFRGFDWKDFAQALAAVNLKLLFLSVCIYISTYVLRGIRWGLMLRNIKPVPLWNITRYVIIGFMCNNVLPARLGEFARALIISRGEKISARASFASVVLERVFDGVTIVGLLLVLMLQQPFPAWVKKMGIVSAVFFALLFIILIILGHRGELWGERLKRWSKGHLGRIASFLLKFINGLHMLRDWKPTLLALALSLLVWAVEVVNYFVVMRSMNVALPIGAAAFTLVVVNLGIMIPSSPGFVGTLQYFCVLALSVYSVPKDPALAYAIVLHAVMYIPITALGLYFLSRTGISLKTLRSSRKYAEAVEEGS